MFRKQFIHNKKMVIPSGKERSRTSSLSVQIAAHSSAPQFHLVISQDKHLCLRVQSFASSHSFLHRPHLPPRCLMLLRRCPRKERSQMVELRQSMKNQVNRQSEDGIPYPEEDCSTRGPSVQLDLSFNLHSMFYYQGRRRLAQTFAFLSPFLHLRFVTGRCPFLYLLIHHRCWVACHHLDCSKVAPFTH